MQFQISCANIICPSVNFFEAQFVQVIIFGHYLFNAFQSQGIIVRGLFVLMLIFELHSFKHLFVARKNCSGACCKGVRLSVVYLFRARLSGGPSISLSISLGAICPGAHLSALVLESYNALYLVSFLNKQRIWLQPCLEYFIEILLLST